MDIAVAKQLAAEWLGDFFVSEGGGNRGNDRLVALVDNIVDLGDLDFRRDRVLGKLQIVDFANVMAFAIEHLHADADLFR
jgi:hypothetical protein